MVDTRESQAIADSKRGDEEGFRYLHDAYRGYVYSLCLSIVSDRDEALDVCQEVFLAVFKGIGSVRDGVALKPWLRRVAVNVCLNYAGSARSGFRTAPARDEALDAAATRMPAARSFAGRPASDPAKEAEDSEERDAVREAMRGLPPDQRMAVALYHQESLAYEEIADLTGWPLGTVKTNLYRGRKAIGRRLRSYFDGGESG